MSIKFMLDDGSVVAVCSAWLPPHPRSTERLDAVQIQRILSGDTYELQTAFAWDSYPPCRGGRGYDFWVEQKVDGLTPLGRKLLVKLLDRISEWDE